jgi:hypothetical protein
MPKGLSFNEINEGNFSSRDVSVLAEKSCQNIQHLPNFQRRF